MEKKVSADNESADNERVVEGNCGYCFVDLVGFVD
jgi:hypothetical protein